MAGLSTKMDIDEAAIDEGLYSRQLYVPPLSFECCGSLTCMRRYVLGHEGKRLSAGRIGNSVSLVALVTQR